MSADAVSDAELNATSRNTAQTITPESPLEFLDDVRSWHSTAVPAASKHFRY
jgi:hypothetical protein